MALLIAAFMKRTVIDCACSEAAVNLLRSDRAFRGLLRLSLTRELDSELISLKWSTVTPNRRQSLKVNPGQWKVSENMVRRIVTDDREFEAAPAIFTRPLAPGWAS